MTRVTCCTAIWLLLNTSIAYSLPPLTRVTIIAEDGSTQVVIRLVSTRALAGTYYVGDGLGYNLHLTLEASGIFQCELNGCNRSKMGTASGKWSIGNDGLRFDADKSEGRFTEQPLRSLQILQLKTHYLFMDERHLDYFKQFGADTFCCFHQDKVREILDQHEVKMRERRVSEAVQNQKKKDK